MKKLLHNLLANWRYMYIGLTLTGMSMILIYDRNFFFWPPRWAPIFNDLRLDIIGLTVGIWIILYALIGKHSNYLIGIPLAIGAAFLMCLMLGEVIHIYFVGFFRMRLALFLEVMVLVDIMYTAFVHDPDL